MSATYSSRFNRSNATIRNQLHPNNNQVEHKLEKVYQARNQCSDKVPCTSTMPCVGGESPSILV